LAASAAVKKAGDVDQATLALVEQIARLGLIGTYALFIVLLIVGVLRIGRQVDAASAKSDAERDRARAEWVVEKARLIAERDAREIALREEYARREGLLAGERDQWRDRATQDGERLDRVAHAFERLAKASAPE
jgi:hypothetical protein